MAATCTSCGAKLGFGRRLTGKNLCENCEHRIAEEARVATAAREAEARQVAEARLAARNRYLSAASNAASDPASAAQLPALAQQAGLVGGALQKANVDVYRRRFESAITDEYLTEEEEQSIDQLGNALNLTDYDVTDVVKSFGMRYLIARTNAGRLMTLPTSAIILKPKEVAHLEVPANLMKEVVHREMRGGYSGFSIPIAKGIRYRTGSYRGRSVVTGTSVEVADQGTLTITSKRAVFKGLRQSVESQFAKIVGINVFDDGIQFHVSNRKTAALFKVPDGHVVAATVNAVIQNAGPQ